MFMLTRLRTLAAVAAAFAAAAPTNAAVEDDFDLESTADLVALCEADPAEEIYAAAMQFCRGFGVGAYHYYLAIAAHNPADRYVCLPDPAPSREALRAEFVAWAHANAAAMTAPPVESLFRYLGETYPCADALPTLEGGRP